MEKTIDLVCGMEVNPAESSLKSEVNGHSFYFCSAECKRRFDEHPQVFIQNHAEAISAS
jgi:Cu+-exporting ATPase